MARFRLRLAGACALLVGLALVQSPGLLVADTKLDLAVAPGRFLLRAVHLWDSIGALGELQNQAYGYLWPMGPFFLSGIESGLPAWVVQRLWVALVLCVAFLGAARLGRELGVRSDLACVLAGFAYALSPRMLSILGQISIEAWPSAMAPWVLLPLVIGSTRGSARRAAAWAALAVVMVGGVNAAATFAVIPLGVLWILTRGRGRRQVTLLLWWPALTVVGTLWWLVPLFVLGSYSPPFLDFIESASNTTFPTTLYDALRGTSNWVVYVGPTSRAGNDLLRDPIAILNSAAVVVLGLVGIGQRRNPERVFLCLSVLVGMLMVTLGHTGAAQGWFAEDLQAALDGALAPLRNVHKFDPVVRLPLVLGLAWAVDALVAQRRRAPGPDADRTTTTLDRVTAFGLVLASVAAVAGAAMPAVLGRITPSGGFVAVPGYWSQTTDWLRERDATALLLPGSSFGDYIWGYPQDEPIQPLARSPWAVRNAVPLTPPGNIRMLDEIEARLAEGSGSPALASYLRRAGITHLVVRNDLVRSGDLPDPVLVHQALAGSEGIFRVTSFGPEIGGAGHIDTEDDSRIVVNGGWQASYPAIEVYAVAGAASAAARTSQVAPVVVGGPEDLLDLTALGVLGDEPTRLAFDVPADQDPGAPVVLTDGLRAVERHFGRLHDGQSATLAPGDPRRLGNPTRDYLPEGSGPWATWARYDGIATVTASSSRSDATSPGAVQRGRLPFAALDGSRRTRWEAAVPGTGTWWQADLVRPGYLPEVTVTAGPDESEVVRVEAGDVTTEPVTVRAGASRTIPIGAEHVDTVRVEDASGRPGHRLALAEVELPGVTATRELVLPPVPEAWGAPARIALRAVSDARTGCAEVDGSVRCVPGRDVAAEEPLGFRRVVTLPTAATYEELQLRVAGRFGPRLQRLLDRQKFGVVTASSTANPDPRSSALAAVDGDPGTTWSAALSDIHPQLDVRWLGARTVRGLELRLLPDADARIPNELVLSWPGGRRVVPVADDGDVRFPPIRTDRLTIGVEEADPAVDLDFDQAASPVPIGVSELRVLGVPYFPRSPEGTIRTRCGAGPDVTIAEKTFRTRVWVSVEDLYAGRTVGARICGAAPVTLPAGESRVSVTASTRFTPVSLVLSDGVAWSSATAAADLDRVSPVDVRVRPAQPGGLLTLHQNVNTGWTAVQGGEDLAPVEVDGWQQGWQLDGGEEVRAEFEPDRTYRAGLVGGAVAVLVLLLLALLPWRRLWGGASRPALPPGRVPGAVLAAVGLGAAGVLAGWPGLGVGAVAIGVGVVTGRRAGLLPWLVVLAMGPAAAAYLWRPWASAHGWAGALAWPHYLVVVSLGLVLGALVELRRPRLRSRRAGSSTDR